MDGTILNKKYDLVSRVEALEKGGGGEPYILPIASDETLGGVKIGENLSIDENGVLSALGGGGGGLAGWYSVVKDNLTGQWSIPDVVFTPKTVEPYFALIIYVSGGPYSDGALYYAHCNTTKPAQTITKLAGSSFTQNINASTGTITLQVNDHSKVIVLSTTEMTVS